MTTDGTETRTHSTWREVFTEHPAIVLTIGGVLIYGAVKFSYFIFYTRLGLDPDDVGLGYQAILSRASLVLSAALALAIGFTVIGLALVWLGERFKPAAKREPVRPLVAKAFFVCAILGFLAVLLPLPFFAARFGTAVRDGYPVSSNFCNISGLRAQVAGIEPVSRGTLPSLVNRDLMYLAEADGQSVFYDYENEVVVRVPTSNVVIRIARIPHRIQSGFLESVLRCRS